MKSDYYPAVFQNISMACELSGKPTAFCCFGRDKHLHPVHPTAFLHHCRDLGIAEADLLELRDGLQSAWENFCSETGIPVESFDLFEGFTPIETDPDPAAQNS